MNDYFSHPFVSNSDLTKLDLETKPVEYQLEYTKAFRRGSIVDAYITQPSALCADELNPTPEEHEIGVFCRAKLYADPFVREILSVSNFQSPFYNPNTKFTYNSIQFTLDTKRLYDGWIPTVKWGWDLKTTSAKTQQQFLAQCEHLQYFRARAWYMLGSNADRDMMIAINPETGSIFKQFVQRGDKHHTLGIKQYSELAYKYWATKV